MIRLATAAFGVVLLCAAVYFMPWQSLPPGTNLAGLLSAVALVVSLVAAAAAFRAMRNTGRLRDDILLLARSIDVALRDVAARTERESATISEMSGAVSREIERLSERIAARNDIAAGPPAASPPAANGDNVVPHPAVRRPRAAPAAAETATPERSVIEMAFRNAVTAGEFDIALQPIVSVSSSAASGFEVFASLPIEGGTRIDLRRLAHTLPGVELAAFERIMVTTALSAGRKRLGAASTAMPLHVAISEAILADARELAPLTETLQFYPDLARSIVLSMPSRVFGAAEHAQALALLSGKGVRFAGEGWDEAAGGGTPIGVEGLDFLKIPANRLLDRDRQRRKLVPVMAIIESAMANDLAIIAVNVANDEDAVSLLDLGIDLMAGPRFGGPKRLKQDGGGRAGRLALL